ncbi:MAG: thiamine phosphate synthase [Velocimicrobium sp.]
MKCDKEQLLLYAVTDRSWLLDNKLCDQVEKALKGGVSFVQLREKEQEEELLLEEAKEMKALCKRYNVPFIINDNVDMALQINADGVHVGQEDMSALKVRQRMGEDKILGVSVQTVKQAIRAEEEGADYLGVGAVFPTNSKVDATDVNYETLQAICKAVTIPVIAIGGISKDNVLELSESGICGVAVISALFAQKDIEQAAAHLREQVEKMVKGC